MKELKDAIGDFTEALRIYEENPKGLYRRAITLIRLIDHDLEKDGTSELWDFDVAEERAEDARKDFRKAVRIVPSDIKMRNALQELDTFRGETWRASQALPPTRKKAIFHVCLKFGQGESNVCTRRREINIERHAGLGETLH